MLLLIGIILTFSLGLGFTMLVKANLFRWERLLLAWVIGLGFVTQELFLLSALNIIYSPWNILGILLLFNVILWFFVHPRYNFNFDLRSIPQYPVLLRNFFMNDLSRLEKVLVCLLIFLIFGAFVKALYWPVYYWDALALYDYRGRIFYEAGGIARAVSLASLPVHGFPAMTSLAHTFIYTLGGLNANPQFIYAMFYLALIVTFYFSARKYSIRWYSLLITVFLASIPFFIEFAANAYTNMPYAFYFGMGTVYLYRFMNEKDRGLLIISSVLLGLAAWTRSPTEQFLLVNLLVLGFWCFRQRRYYYAPLVLIFAFLAFYLPWKAYIHYALGITVVANEMAAAVNAGITSAFDIGRFFTVIKLLVQSIKDVSGAPLILAALTSLLFLRQAKKNIYLLLFWVLNLSAFVVGSYVFSLSWHDWQDSIANSANRLSMFLPPFVLYYVAVSIPDFLITQKVTPKKKSGKLKGGS